MRLRRIYRMPARCSAFSPQTSNLITGYTGRSDGITPGDYSNTLSAVTVMCLAAHKECPLNRAFWVILLI